MLQVTTKKNLKWDISLGSALVNVCFTKPELTIECTTIQMIILMCFNSCDNISFNKLINKSRGWINKIIIQTHLKSLLDLGIVKFDNDVIARDNDIK